MNEFLLLFRLDIISRDRQPTQEEMKIYMEQWNHWIDGISVQKKLAQGGNHLQYDGKVVTPGGEVSNGPFAVNKQSVAGYIIILADDYDEAVKIAQKCPILTGEGNSVEIRQIASS